MTTPSTTAKTRQRLPSQIGDYRLRKRIGKGGRSYVFTAEQRLLQRTVAIKILRPDLVGRAAHLIAFKREAAAYGRCDHPHILTCHQAGQDGDWHYMALTHAPQGDTIRALQGASRRRALHEVLQWTAQLAEAAGYIHELGYVHGDIKPANILVAADRRALLADLGAMTALADADSSRRFEGTAAYMAPEQARREGLGLASDLFAIGASAWHLLAGRAPRPPTGDKHQALRRAAEEPIPALRMQAPWVPASVEAIIQRCVQSDPTHRYQRAGDLALAARQVLESLQNTTSDQWQPAVDLGISY